MKLLILGGTLFLGRHVTEAALARGDSVTLFNRGKTGPDLFPGAERIRGDRATDLAALAGRTWDAVVDTCGYLPRVVGASAAALRESCEHYTFISSISAYAAPAPPGADEDAPLAEIDETLADEFTAERYGALKALGERAVEQEFPGRSLIVRSGLLVGPYDPTQRLRHWVRRIAAGGDVLAPGSPARAVQLIDARDLAEWILNMAQRRESGTFNVSGPATPLSMGPLLERIASITGSDARFVWVGEKFLLEHGVAPWAELPIWLPEDMNGILEISIERALMSGLRFRPLDETIRDVIAWEDQQPSVSGDNLASGAPTSGELSRAREVELLEEWSRGGADSGN
jgi:2'-hydroxyisoflavone reductase